MSSINPDDSSAEQESIIVQSSEEASASAAEATSALAEYETNGGPLGCCLGVTIGIVLSLVIGVISRFYADPLASVLGGGLSTTIRILMAIVGLAAAIVFGYLGWRIGRKVYKEYDPPVIKERRRQTKAKPRRIVRT